MSESCIEYRKGDLFDAPKEAILVHACNAQGVWGSGVAKTFKEKFPEAFKEYHSYCQTEMIETDTGVKFEKRQSTRKIVGDMLLVHLEDSQRIGCLITSNDYGSKVDNPTQILQATRTSLKSLVDHLVDGDEIHMPKINSDRFKTPWDETVKCIESIVSNSGKAIKCVVWELD